MAESWSDINSPGYWQKQAASSAPASTTAATDDPVPAKKKKDPEYRIKKLSVIVPKQGLVESDPFDIEGEVEPIGSSIKSPRVLLDAVTEYQGAQDVIKKGLESSIDKNNKFKATFPALYYNDKFQHDTKKAVDATFTLVIIANGTTAEKEFRSSPLSLPSQVSDSLPLKKGHYDDTANKNDAAKYPASGENYKKGTSVTDLQKSLISFRYLAEGNTSGYFGELTEKALKEFQADSLKKPRLDEKKKKLVETASITYAGSANGIYDVKAQKEMQAWRAEHWLRPMVEAHENDFDLQAVINGIKQRGSEAFHEVAKPIVEIQERLKKVDAYHGAIDGWFGPKMKDALKLFQKAAANDELLVNGQKKSIGKKLEGHKEGVGDLKSQVKLKETVDGDGKVEKQEQKSVKSLCEKHWEAHKDNCSGFVKAVASELNISLSGQANDIVDQIQLSPWTVLKDGKEAADAAGEGKFVIAGLNDKGYGHVAIIVSGVLAQDKYPTGYWGTLNAIGKKNTTINWSWTEEERDSLTYAAITF